MTSLKILEIDPWLESNAEALGRRFARFQDWQKSSGGELHEQSQGHHYFGINFEPKTQEWVYREWAPRAHQLFLTGDFCQWSPEQHPLTKDPNSGIWEIRLPAQTLSHADRIKVRVIGDSGTYDRIPAWIQKLTQDPETHDFCGQVWAPEPYQWENLTPKKPSALLIYEAHVGMGTEQKRVGTYREFATDVLPHVAKLGYTAVQLMAIAEHPYYGSFGYHVANYFAPSSRCGTPEDLKFLIDQAHGLGLQVLMDIVHSHSVKNIAEGLAHFDGQPGLYFKEHEHPLWDSMLFDYSRDEVRHFLLSNLTYWMEEFHFDGFRFDGVTSMLYHHHGDIVFDNYERYFDDQVDNDAVFYLQVANALIHQINPQAITIAEDMSGMPGLCLPIEDGGIGFDYRLAMGIPDHWIKLLKHTSDENWNLDELLSVLQNRRTGEKTIAYAESHDQALVGDKTLAFWLMDAAMYHHMGKDDDNLVIDRGIALHKLIRLITLALGGEAYLTFMGNEFGHPEWVDFPREGNDWSYHYARRQWSLANNPELKYQELQAFDQALMHLAPTLLKNTTQEILNIDQDNLCLQIKLEDSILVLNFHPQNSIPDYEFPTHDKAETRYQITLSTDDKTFGGHARVTSGQELTSQKGTLKAYLPSRCGFLLEKVTS